MQSADKCSVLCREDLFEEMIRERPDVAAKREECRMALRALKEALSALESLPADLISRINGGSLAAMPLQTAASSRMQHVYSASNARSLSVNSPD